MPSTPNPSASNAPTRRLLTPGLSSAILLTPALTRFVNGRMLVLPLLLACLSAAGCSLFGGGPPPIRYYLIDEVAGKTLRSNQPTLALEIRDLHLPQYLDRFHLVQRLGDGEIFVAEDHQWGESLQKNLLRVLVSNLSQRLATNDIGTPLVPSVSAADYRLVVDISQFEHNADGKIRLQARWQLTTGLRNTTVVTEQASLVSEKAFEPDQYRGSVQAMSTVFAKLSDRLAASVITAQTDAEQ